jgi:hypothetical protein
MSGHSSQNRLARKSPSTTILPRTVISVLPALIFLVSLGLAAHCLPETLLGRTIGAHLSQLADADSWTR